METTLQFLSGLNYILVTILAFVLILGLLVIIHELGHFLTARLFGVRVEEFGVGFPPRVYPRAEVVQRRREQGKTVYSLNALPLGGFVRLAGENGVSPPTTPTTSTTSSTGTAEAQEASSLALGGGIADANDPGAFGTKPAWQRAIVLVAGAFNNMVLAMILFFCTLAIVGTPHAQVGIVGVEVHSPANRAGLRPGDVIRRVAGQVPANAGDVLTLVQARAGQPVPIEVAGPGGAHTVTLVPRPRLQAGCNQGPMGVMTTEINPHYASIGTAQAAGNALALPIDVVQGILALPSAISAAPPTRCAAPPSYICADGSITSNGHSCDYAALAPQGAALQDSCLPATANGGVAGPIGIIRQVGCEANAIPTQGWAPLLSLVIELSATLAVINLLPFPALDGGRLLFVLISLVARRRVRPEIEALAHAIGMVALLSLMLFISLHDLSNLFAGKSAFGG